MNTIELILTVRVRKYSQPPFLVSKFYREYISKLCYEIKSHHNYITFCPDIISCNENCKVCWQKAIDKVKEGGEPLL